MTLKGGKRPPPFSKLALHAGGQRFKFSITEQRGFLKSFIERLEVADKKVKIYYTIPMPPHDISQETAGVLPFVHHG